MIVIKALINQSNPDSKALPRVISRVLSLLARFDEFKVFHILCEHNSTTNKWAKHGSNLGEGEIVVNEARDFLHIPLSMVLISICWYGWQLAPQIMCFYSSPFFFTRFEVIVSIIVSMCELLYFGRKAGDSVLILCGLFCP